MNHMQRAIPPSFVEHSKAFVPIQHATSSILKAFNKVKFSEYLN